MPIRRLDDFADTYVFNKQSLGPILCGRFRLARARRVHLPPAPLLPKLRGHFAEFLNQDSLERLRLLASPTCVGLRYGHTHSSFTKLFSAVRLRSLSEVRRLLRRRISAFTRRICLPGNAYFLASFMSLETTDLSPLRPSLNSSAVSCGTGMLTRFPSATPFGLTLGAD